MRRWIRQTIATIVVCTSCVVCASGGVYAGAVEKGKYPTDAGTILVTPDNQNKLARVFKLGHAGLVLNKTTAVEATLPRVTTSKNNWKNRSQVRQLYGATVKSASKAQRKKVANWCRRQVGKNYNTNYTNTATRKKFYCSQLIWAGYKDVCKIDLNTGLYGKMVAPIELVNTPRTNLVYSFTR